ncbi:MFS general substrate transporter, partial [Nadsonia fulvescens var. elongata DSM 6958]
MLCLTRAVWLYQFGRFLQGMSAGVIWTVGLAVVSDTATPENIGYLMGYPGVGMSLGIVLGPTIGGAVYDKAGYYPVYYVCFAVIGFDIFLRFFMLEKRQLRSKLMALGYALDDELLVSNVTTAVTPQSDSLTQTENKVHESEKNAMASRFKIPTFIYLLKYPRISVGALQSIAMAWVLGSLDATLTIHLNELFHYNSLNSGLVFLSLAIPSFAGPLVGLFVDKYGPRIPVTLGLVLTFVFMVLLRLPTFHSAGQVVLMCAMLFCLGLSQAFIIGPSMADVGTSVAKEEAKIPGRFGEGKGFAQVYGLYNVGYSVGSLVGPQIAGRVKESRGWGMSTISTGLVCLIVAIPSVLITGGNLLYPWYSKHILKVSDHVSELSPAVDDRIKPNNS